MSSDGFYDAGVLRQIATNLFYGWGYNFYRAENQLRADDQLVRSKAASLLGIAMASVIAAETEYRREFSPRPPGRNRSRMRPRSRQPSEWSGWPGGLVLWKLRFNSSLFLRMIV